MITHTREIESEVRQLREVNSFISHITEGQIESFASVFRVSFSILQSFIVILRMTCVSITFLLFSMTSVDSSKDLKTVPFQTHEPEDPNYTHFSILIPTDQETVDGYFAIKLDNAVGYFDLKNKIFIPSSII